MEFILKVSSLNGQICSEFKGRNLPEVLSEASSGGPVRGRGLCAARSGWALNLTAWAHWCEILPRRKAWSSVILYCSPSRNGLRNYILWSHKFAKMNFIFQERKVLMVMYWPHYLTVCFSFYITNLNSIADRIIGLEIQCSFCTSPLWACFWSNCGLV